jgi:hypothetical protein
MWRSSFTYINDVFETKHFPVMQGNIWDSSIAELIEWTDLREFLSRQPELCILFVQIQARNNLKQKKCFNKYHLDVLLEIVF